MPLTQMDGSYVFEYPSPPTWRDDFTALHSLQSASFDLNGSLFQSQGGYLRVDNNLALDTHDRLRDSYAVVATLGGTFAEVLVLHAGGLEFDQVGPSPSALDGLELPTSAEDLAGFGVSDYRSATLTFENLQLGSWFTASAPIQDLMIVPVPEPAQLSLFGLALITALVYGIRMHQKVQPAAADNSHHP
jgi:hypothetical protein